MFFWIFGVFMPRSFSILDVFLQSTFLGVCFDVFCLTTFFWHGANRYSRGSTCLDDHSRLGLGRSLAPVLIDSLSSLTLLSINLLWLSLRSRLTTVTAFNIISCDREKRKEHHFASTLRLSEHFCAGTWTRFCNSARKASSSNVDPTSSSEPFLRVREAATTDTHAVVATVHWGNRGPRGGTGRGQGQPWLNDGARLEEAAGRNMASRSAVKLRPKMVVSQPCCSPDSRWHHKKKHRFMTNLNLKSISWVLLVHLNV